LSVRRVELVFVPSKVPHNVPFSLSLWLILLIVLVAAGRSKIICTIGPACWELAQLEALIDAGGMNVSWHFNR
jgi:hypothetical protein